MSDTQGNQLTTPIQPNISFTQIPANIQVPGNYIEIDVNNANVGLLPFPARQLVIGQMLPAGTATAGKVYTITGGPAQAVNLFGAGSMLADMVLDALATNSGIPLDAVGLAAPSGATAATGLLAFSGAATAVGSQPIGVAGYRIPFTISPGDTPSTMAANFVAAAEATSALTPLPVSFATNSTAGQVVITALSAGAMGNSYDIRVDPAPGDTTVPGVGIAVTAMSGGTGTPTISTVLSNVASTWYTDMSAGWNDATTQGAVAAYLTEQAEAMTSLDGVAYTAFTGTQGQIAALGPEINNQFVVALGVTLPQQPPWRIAASLMGLAALNFMNDPARQIRGLILPNIIAPAVANVMLEPEQNALLLDGIATWTATVEGSVAVQRLVTTYTISPLGAPDQSWQDVMSVKVISRIRWDWKNYLSLTYPNNKLADDDSLAAEYDASIVTPRRLKGAWAARCRLYEQVGWIENSAATAAASIFVRDPSNRNKVNAQLQVQVIGNLMITAQQLVFVAGI